MSQASRGQRKKQVGIVISDKMDKTITVQTERLVKHKLYDKYMRRHGKITAHDEKNECHVGDKVMVIESRPLSKKKRWRLTKKIKEAGAA